MGLKRSSSTRTLADGIAELESQQKIPGVPAAIAAAMQRIARSKSASRASGSQQVSPAPSVAATDTQELEAKIKRLENELIEA